MGHQWIHYSVIAPMAIINLHLIVTMHNMLLLAYSSPKWNLDDAWFWGLSIHWITDIGESFSAALEANIDCGGI